MLVLLAAPQLARAEANGAPSATPAATTSSCGKTVEDKLAAARRALQTNDTASQAALACLIEATASLNDRLRGYEADRSQFGLLHAPSRDITNLRQPGQ